MRKSFLMVVVLAGACSAKREPPARSTPSPAPVAHTDRRPHLPAQEPSPTAAPVKDNGLFRVLREDLPDPAARTEAILRALRASGRPTATQQEGAAAFRKAFPSQMKIADWGCFAAGCFFRVDSSDSLGASVVAARDQSGLNKLTVIVQIDNGEQLVVVAEEDFHD